MAENVPADGLGRVAEVGVGVRGDLVRDDGGGVVEVADLVDVVEVFVELLLALGELATTDVLRTEVGGERVDTDQSNGPVGVLVLAGDLLGLLSQQDLVVGVERLRDVDPIEDRLDELVHRVLAVGTTLDLTDLHRGGDRLLGEATNHLGDPLGPERVF